MMSREDNLALAQVGRGTPAGELLRRYWQPVAAAWELSEEDPVKKVRLLGEDLVLFRTRPTDGSPVQYGLVGESCSHRGVSLAFGRAEAHGLRCPYHGWVFGPTGKCLETPAEPADSTLKDRIRHVGYPVEKLGGLLFAYLGPQPAPLLPRWDVLAREDGWRYGVIESVMNCNWLQPMENSVDPNHLYWLHGYFGADKEAKNKDRFAMIGLHAEFNERNEFVPFEFGIQKRRITPGKNPGDPERSEQHPLVFPTALRLVIRLVNVKNQGYQAAQRFTDEDWERGWMHNMQFRMPIDDFHTRVFHVNFLPSKTRRITQDDPVVFEHCPLKNEETGKYNFNIVTAQDAMAWETQGALTDRSRENLGHSDRGIALLRRMLKEQIAIVREGRDPLGLIRDPAKNTPDLGVYHEAHGASRGV